MRSGDKVRVKAGNKQEGRTGTVTKDSEAGGPVDVELDDQSSAWYSFAEQELEAIE